MQALANAGWRGGRLEDVQRFLAGESIPEKTCIITFDDGYLDNYVHAHPILKEFGLTAVLFVVTGWLGDNQGVRPRAPTGNHNFCKQQIANGTADDVMLRWCEMEDMRASNTFEFHSHTHTHTRWDKQIPDVSERQDRLSLDLRASKALLESRIGASKHLCWPQGYYDEQYIQTAKAEGFEYLYTVEPRINNRQVEPTRLGRFVTKEKSGDWLLSRTRLYSRPWLGGMYAALRSK